MTYLSGASDVKSESVAFTVVPMSGYPPPPPPLQGVPCSLLISPEAASASGEAWRDEGGVGCVYARART